MTIPHILVLCFTISSCASFNFLYGRWGPMIMLGFKVLVDLGVGWHNDNSQNDDDSARTKLGTRNGTNISRVSSIIDDQLFGASD
jgi:hypothetical protein